MNILLILVHSMKHVSDTFIEGILSVSKFILITIFLATSFISTHAQTSITSEGTDSLLFYTAGNKNMVLTHDGKLRLGTLLNPNPSAILQLNSTTGGLLIPRMTTVQRDGFTNATDATLIYNTTLARFQIRQAGAWVDILTTATTANIIQDADADTKIEVEQSADEDKIRVSTAGAERMIIDETGNVGIGTSSPDAKLNVEGTWDIGISNTVTGFSAGAIGSLNTVSGNRAIAIGSSVSAGHLGTIVMGDWDGGGAASLFSSANNQFTSRFRGGYRFYTDAASTSTSGIFFTNAGSVGLGTTSPSEKLDIVGNVNYSNALKVNGSFGTASYLLTSQAGGVNTWTDPATLSSGLEFITESANSGWRFIGANAANYGDIGANAVDLSYSFGASTTRGATGDYSTAMGFSTTASGYASTAMGNYTISSGYASTASGYISYAEGDYSTAMGYNVTASGIISTAMGFSTTAPSYSETAVGAYNTTYTPASTSAWNTADRLFVIGNGTGSGAGESNALTIYKNGTMNINDAYDMPTADGTINGQVLTTNGAGVTSFQTPGNDGDWTISGSNMYSAVSGNVGIGNTNPSVKLDVTGSTNILSSSADPLVVRSSTDGFALRVKESDNGNDAVSIFGYGTRGRITMNSNGVTNINFDADGSLDSYINTGNVGIGTATPSAKLHISGGDGIMMVENGNNSSEMQMASLGTGSQKLNTAGTKGYRMWVYGDGYAPNPALQGDYRMAYVSGTGHTSIFNIDRSGKVGIGFSGLGDEPQTTLDVNGQITMQSGAVNGYLPVSDANGTMTWTDPATITTGNDGDWTISGSNMYSAVSGNVGIGLSSPSAKLDVWTNTTDDAALTSQIVNQNDGAADFRGLYVLAQSTGSASEYIAGNFQSSGGGIGTSIALEASAFGGATNWAAYFSSGNVYVSDNLGIGTTTPNAPLQFSNTFPEKKIVLYEGANNDHQYYGFGMAASELQYHTDQPDADHVFYSAINNASSKELMRIEGGGAVSIGRSTPINTSTVLTIEKNIAGTGYGGMYVGTTSATGKPFYGFALNGVSTSYFYFDGANDRMNYFDGGDRLTVTGVGNVGIGTTNPDELLHVNGSAAGTGAHIGNLYAGVWDGNTDYAAFAHNTVKATTGSYALIQNSAGETFLNSATGRPIHFRINNADRMYLSSAGNLGIGTTSTSYRLEVESVSGDGYVAEFNRLGGDGAIIRFLNDGVFVGSISESGGTVSYNAFTGSHYAWSKNEHKLGELLVLTGDNYYANKEEEGEPIYGIATSISANDPKVLGSYLDPILNEEEEIQDGHRVMAVGNGEMFVVNNGENLEIGDYLISSDVAGHAMLDKGEYEVSYIVARVAEPVNWDEEQKTIEGRKVKRISVFFETFVINHKADKLEQDLHELKKEYEIIKADVKHIKNSLDIEAKANTELDND